MTLEVVGTLALDLTELAITLDQIISEGVQQTAPYPVGIYTRMSPTPLVEFGKVYSVVSNGAYINVVIGRWSDISSDVYDTEFNLVLRYYKEPTLMQQLYSDAPVASPNALKLATALLGERVYNKQEWCKGKANLLDDFFLIYNIVDEGREAPQRVAVEELIVNCDTPARGLTDVLNAWIGKDTWNIYTTRQVGYQVFITKHLDYRIYDWMRLQKEGKVSLPNQASGKWTNQLLSP
jgi:hypothetical protein